MQIAKMDTVCLNVSEQYTKLNTRDSKSLSFSTLMQQIIADGATSIQEAPHQKQSDSSHDCDKSMAPCKCNSDKETGEATEAKKSGIAACMDCIRRKNGQCDMWNGENKDRIFNLFPISSRNNATQAGIAKSLDLQTPLDVIAKASSEYDYTYAYASIRKKLKNATVE